MRLPTGLVALVLVGSLLGFSTPVRAQECGNGVIEDGETCDPPGSPAPGSSATCRSDCTFCGDGVIQSGDQETCDDGPYPTCGYCSPYCRDRIFPADGWGECPCAFDDPALVAVRADIVAACDCGNAASHAAFAHCARAKLVASPLVIPPCRVRTLKCLTRSVCGNQGAVTCCRTSANGRQHCLIKPDAAHCTAPRGGSASLGVSDSCCDACP